MSPINVVAFFFVHSLCCYSTVYGLAYAEISQFSLYMGRTYLSLPYEHFMNASFDLCIISIIINANDGPSFVLVLARTVFGTIW